MCILVLCLVLIFCYWVQSNESINSIRFIVSCSDGEEEILLHMENGIYYAFLPSYADDDNTVIHVGSGDTIYIDNQKYENGASITGLEFDVEHTIVVKNPLGLTVNNEVLVIMKSANIPAISIQLVDSKLFEIDGDKTIKKSGTMTVFTEDGTVNYSGVFRSMQSRGNATWSSEKKPYKIEFDNDTELLKLGACKEWVLLANSYDASNLKNKIIFEAAKKLGVRFVSDSQFVDLYVNGEYRGLYLLAEKIEIGINSVNIKNLELDTQEANYKKLSSYSAVNVAENLNGIRQMRTYDIPNNPKDISGGYILKSEMESRISVDSYFVTSGGRAFACESPKYATSEQMNYISGLFTELVNRKGNHEALAEIIDIDSFINRYLLNECFANYEGSSNYFIKDSDAVDSKIYAEPVWDFDAAWGTYKTVNPIGLYAFDDFVGEVIYSDPILLKQAQEAFFSRMHPILQETVDEIPKYANYISNSDKMNKIRWACIYGETDNLDNRVVLLTDYLEQRIAFLNEYWSDTSKYAVISFVDNGYFYTNAIEMGSSIGETAIREKDGYTFMGWHDRIDGELLDSTEPIYENRVYVPKWEENEPMASEDSGIRDLKSTLQAIKKDVRMDPGKYVVYIWVTMLVTLLIILLAKELLIIKRRNRHG